MVCVFSTDMATNFFGQGANRGLLGKLTDWMRNGYYDPGSGVTRPDPVGQQQDIAGNWFTPTAVASTRSAPLSQDQGPSVEDLFSQISSGTGGGTATEPEILPTWMFEGNVFNDFIQYLTAKNAEVDRTYQEGLGQLNQSREKVRGDVGRQKTSFLEQVARLFEDLSSEEKKGQSNIGAYYGGLGDIYQSSQGVRENEFASEVGRERSRIGQDRDKGIGELDRVLDEYLQASQIDEQDLGRRRTAALDNNYQSAADLRSNLAVNPTAQLRSVNPTSGAVSVTDTSALLNNLNSFLTPNSLRQRYNQATPSGNISSYLNPLG